MFLGSGLGILVILLYALLVIGAVVLLVLLARLILSATRTLDVVREERRVRTDLLIAERGDELEP